MDGDHDDDHFQEIVGEPLQGTMVWWINVPGRGRRNDISGQTDAWTVSEREAAPAVV